MYTKNEQLYLEVQEVTDAPSTLTLCMETKWSWPLLIVNFRWLADEPASTCKNETEGL